MMWWQLVTTRHHTSPRDTTRHHSQKVAYNTQLNNTTLMKRELITPDAFIHILFKSKRIK